MKKSSNQLHPAVFLDRDGTINVDVGYPDSLEKIEIIPGAPAAVKCFNRRNYKVIVVTNQSGVARGLMTEEQVRDIHRGMHNMFSQQGARIDDFYYCPHHPDIGLPPYRKKCRCRKPEPELFLQAARDHSLDLSKSIMIGDKYSDVEAGKRLGMVSILVLTGAGEIQYRRFKDDKTIFRPDYVAKDIEEAAAIIERDFGKAFFEQLDYPQ